MLVLATAVGGISIFSSIYALLKKDRKEKEEEFRQKKKEIEANKEKQKQDEELKKKRIEEAKKLVDKVYAGICFAVTWTKNLLVNCVDYAMAYYERFEEEILVATSIISFSFSINNVLKCGSFYNALNFKPKTSFEKLEYYMWTCGNNLNKVKDYTCELNQRVKFI